ncbi:MAG TPA: P-II family nitrogen regulator [Dehalococcoidia bacterium]|nr:P-II family nitrogen regulator [Dehalococcoidia bacterium]
MKEVIAIVRPERWRATIDALAALGVTEAVHQRVLGRGRQRGLRYLRRSAGGQGGDMLFLPKRLIRCAVEDRLVDAVVGAVIDANQTGNVGDGKVFVRPLALLEEAGETAATQPEEAVRSLA